MDVCLNQTLSDTFLLFIAGVFSFTSQNVRQNKYEAQQCKCLWGATIKTSNVTTKNGKVYHFLLLLYYYAYISFIYFFHILV